MDVGLLFFFSPFNQSVFELQSTHVIGAKSSLKAAHNSSHYILT